MTYLTAQICTNGHIITDAYREESDKINKNCKECGAKNITNCPNCDAPIQGRWITSWASTGEVRPLRKSPNFCHACGTPYPWTLIKRDQIIELINEIPDLQQSEKDTLIKSISYLSSDDSLGVSSAERFKRFFADIQKNIGSALYKLVIDISSETVKRIIESQ